METHQLIARYIAENAIDFGSPNWHELHAWANRVLKESGMADLRQRSDAAELFADAMLALGIGDPDAGGPAATVIFDIRRPEPDGWTKLGVKKHPANIAYVATIRREGNSYVARDANGDLRTRGEALAAIDGEALTGRALAEYLYHDDEIGRVRILPDGATRVEILS